jgi:hypothetical protein
MPQRLVRRGKLIQAASDEGELTPSATDCDVALVIHGV